MKKHYSGELNHLKEMVLRMGGLAETMTHRAVQALVERNREMLADVKTLEQQVNQLHIEIDEIALEMIALRQPRFTTTLQIEDREPWPAITLVGQL